MVVVCAVDDHGKGRRCCMREHGSGLDQPAIPTLKAQRRQTASLIGAGVYADPVRSKLHLRMDGMPVHDYLGEGAAMIKERVAYPSQISLILLVQRGAWVHPGVDEHVIAHHL